MIHLPVNIGKFSFPELFNDSQGKTQAILVCGFCGFFSGLLGVGMCWTTPPIMEFMIGPCSKDFLEFMDNAGDRCFQIASICFTGLTLNIFSKDKTVNTKETANLPKPVETVTEVVSGDLQAKETIKEYKTPDSV